MSKRTKNRSAQKTAPRRVVDYVQLHMIPLRGSAGPEGNSGGVALQLVAYDEDDVVVQADTVKLGALLEKTVGDIDASERERILPGQWIVQSHEEDDREELYSAIDGNVRQVSNDEFEVGLCEDCHIGEPCDVWGPRGALTFVPMPPPEPEVDGESVQAICGMLLDADENGGLAIETLSAALARYTALRVRPAAKNAVTMTPGEAAKVLGVDWPCEPEVVMAAFRTMVSRAHPDAPGGSTADIRRVKDAKSALDAVFEDASTEDEGR